MINLKKSRHKYIQEIREAMKRPNQTIIGIDEEETQVKVPENIFNKIRNENFFNPKKEVPIKCLFQANGPKKKVYIAILKSDKIDFISTSKKRYILMDTTYS